MNTQASFLPEADMGMHQAFCKQAMIYMQCIFHVAIDGRMNLYRYPAECTVRSPKGQPGRPQYG
jgi:hypothetical protein